MKNMQEIIEVDLHNLKIDEAKNYLDKIINTAPKHTKEIIVIHGYNRGHALADMIRNKYHHKRIERKFLSINQGITSLILK